MLLENGAKVDELDDISSTALSWAVYRARPEVVALLLEFGADPRRLSINGVSSLEMIEEYLKSHTQKPYTTRPNRLERLEKMTRYKKPSEAAEKWMKCRELLTQRIEELEKEEGKPLKRERRSDSSSDIEVEKDILLFQAIRKKNLTPDARLGKIKDALERGANVNAQHDNIRHKNTPLHLAVKKEQEETVAFLLQRGANVQLKNNKGETPLDLAKNNPKILSLSHRLKLGLGGHFKEQGPRRSLLGISFDKEAEFDGWTLADYAAQYSDDLSLRFLQLHSWDLTKQNSVGQRPLEIAAEQANEVTLKALIK